MWLIRLALAAAAVALVCSDGRAQAYPSRLIRAFIPFGAGSGVDIIPRIVFEQLSQQLGQPIVVENRPGGAGTVGTAVAAKADPDGYTLLVASSANTITPAIYPNLSYDMAKDFAAVGVIGSVPNVLIISPDKGIRTIRDFVAAVKAKPGSFNFATVGVGSAVHLSAERFRLSAGFEAVHIPFKGGAEALAEVISGRVDYYFCPLGTALPFIQEGKLLALAVSSPRRASALPDVPTTLESGFADSDYTFWVGVAAPARTPAPIVEKLHMELAKALKVPAVQAKLAKLGVEPMSLTPAEFDAHIKKELVVNAAFAKAAGLKPN